MYQSFEAFFKAGLDQYHNKLYQDALSSFEKARNLAPTEAASYLWMAEAYRSLGKEDMALSHLEKAAELDPGNAEPYLCIAGIFAERGDLVAETKALEKAVEDTANSASRQNALAFLAIKRQDYETALNHFLYADELDPDNDQALAAMGETFILLGRYHEARNVLAHAATLPTVHGKMLAEIMYDIGVAEFRMGNRSEAKESFRSSLNSYFYLTKSFQELLKIEIADKKWINVLRLVLWMLKQVFKR